MTMTDIRLCIKDLAKSQGSYGRLDRLLTALATSDPEQYGSLAQELESKNFKDTVDLIMYLEG